MHWQVACVRPRGSSTVLCVSGSRRPAAFIPASWLLPKTQKVRRVCVQSSQIQSEKGMQSKLMLCCAFTGGRWGAEGVGYTSKLRLMAPSVYASHEKCRSTLHMGVHNGSFVVRAVFLRFFEMCFRLPCPRDVIHTGSHFLSTHLSFAPIFFTLKMS